MPALRRIALLGLIALLGCDDDDENFSSRDGTGLDNGERCMATAVDAPICSGRRCVDFGTGAQFGACTEVCTDSCRWGGLCVRIEGQQNRLCVRECTSGADCPSGFGCIGGEGYAVCTEEFTCQEDPDKTWCLPLPQ